MVSFGTALAALVVTSVLVSLGVVRALDRSGRRWGDVLRARLVWGVPWGTIVVVGFVLSVYLFVQDGITDFHRPVVIPFRAWSYLYPLGVLTAGFSHGSSGHVIGNLLGTLVIAPIVEYAWGHYPEGRDDRDSDGVGARDSEKRPVSGVDGVASALSSAYANPRIRAFVVFPLATIGVGLATSALALGPVIGFSGVVFAFAGFAIVRYPITTIVAVVGAQGVVSTLYRALTSPILEVTAEPRPPSPPWWAEIAIQGHALGFLIGVVLGVAVFRRRSFRPDPVRLWIALLVYGFAKSFWAVYWFRGSDTFVLYRGPGVVIVAALAIVVTVAIAGSDRPLLDASGAASIVPGSIARRWRRLRPGDPDSARRTRADDLGRSIDRALELATVDRRRRADGDRSVVPSRIRQLAAPERSERSSDALSRRRAAFLAVLAVLAMIAGPAIPANAFTIDDDPATSASTVTVEDYSVSYAEDVRNPLVSFVQVPGLEQESAAERSGVIVSSERRHLWTRAVSTDRLAFEGRSRVIVGGPGWRDSVTAIREGWEVAGNDTVYQVWLRPEGEDRRHAFASESARADVLIGGRNVTVVPEDGTFYVAVEDDGSATAVEIPDDGETAEAGGIAFVREGEDLYATTDETRVRVASRETYE